MGIYAPSLLIDAPPIQPVRFGLLSVARVIDNADAHALNGVRFKSPACQAAVVEFTDVCPPSDNPEKVATDSENDEFIEADDLITLYANLSCRTTSLEALFDEAREIFALGEGRALERTFWAEQLATPDATVLNTVPGVDGALSVAAGIAALESYMASCYPGRPTFHSDRATVPFAYADHQLIRVGTGLETALGSAWAAYSDSPNTGPDGAPAPDGHVWLYATSEITIYRWDIEVYPDSVGYVLKKNADGGQTNEPQVLVERRYLPVKQCCTAAVLVCVSGCE